MFIASSCCGSITGAGAQGIGANVDGAGHATGVATGEAATGDAHATGEAHATGDAHAAGEAHATGDAHSNRDAHAAGEAVLGERRRGDGDAHARGEAATGDAATGEAARGEEHANSGRSYSCGNACGDASHSSASFSSGTLRKEAPHVFRFGRVTRIGWNSRNVFFTIGVSSTPRLCMACVTVASALMSVCFEARSSVRGVGAGSGTKLTRSLNGRPFPLRSGAQPVSTMKAPPCLECR